MRNSIKPIRILGSEYAQSKARLEKLQNIIIDAKDAEAVLKYAERFQTEIERETLEALLKPSANHEEIVMYYRVVCRFTDMLRSTVSLGEQKKETFEQLKAGK